MINLFFRSALVLALLFGLLFAVGMGVVIYFDLPSVVAVAFALGALLLQYVLGPFVLELIYKIEWREANSLDPQLAAFMEKVCAEHGIPAPRFGVIRDGNPNAFTFGHYPGDARLVVISGLMDRLDPEERQAVVAHELGHIAHWDFVVMTMAAAIPLVLYVLYITIRGSGRQKYRSGGYAALIGLLSYAAYIISQYIVLMLSRIREYYADQFSGEQTRNPDALSSALVKIAYGLARAPKEAGKKDDSRMVAGRAFGIFDPKVAQTLALIGAGTGAVSAAAIEDAMKWDLWNPWAGLFELNSSHPLPAKRIRALEQQTREYRPTSRFRFQAERPESYWDEFLVDGLVQCLPLLGLLGGTAASLALGIALGASWKLLGIALLCTFGGWWLQRRFSYRHAFDEARNVKSLIGEVKVSAVRSIPCTIAGKIIGRGVPGLFYSEDFVLQDDSGFLVLDYRQPLRIVEFLLGWRKAEKLIGLQGSATGWYRRAPRPYFELRTLTLETGEKVTSYVYPLTQSLVYAGLDAGILMTILA
ncbi:MAG: M48 family metalloprotease [Anaerolineales bacterium]|nr:M48 family metalloprotease [Anaerolineales bacterium]